MIVRNAAPHLGRCLASLRAVVDEIVVVDTGSTDETIEIAEASGARVSLFSWIDDFSAARNAALSLVITDWFLSIDADEELVCRHAKTDLEQLFGACEQALLGVVDSGNKNVVMLPRLFRKIEGTHWIHPVHEVLVQPGRPRQVTVDPGQGLFIEHHGYTSDQATAKIERNLRLLEMHLRAEPENLSSLFYYARELAWAGRFEESLRNADQLLVLADEEGPAYADALAVAAWSAVSLARFQEAAEFGRRARRLNLPTVWTEYFLGVALANMGNKSKAIEAAERACSLPYPTESMLALQEIWTSKRFELRQLLLTP